MRPINMPDAEPTRVRYRDERYWQAVDARPVSGGSGVVVLEPTPAQLAREQRVLWIETSAHKPVRDLAELARRHGWWAGIARSRFIDEVQTAAGRLKGQRPTREMVTVRFEHPGRMLAGWAGWLYTEQVAEWATKGGQVAILATWQPRAILSIQTLGVTEIENVIKGG